MMQRTVLQCDAMQNVVQVIKASFVPLSSPHARLLAMPSA